MKTSEVTQPSLKILTETFDQTQSGFLTEDLINVTQVVKWSAPMSSDDLDGFLQQCGVNLES